MIELRDVTKRYGPARSGAHPAVDDVSVTIDAGEIFSVVGYSGAGKSTLVRLINGLERPTSGTVRVDGHDVNALSARALRHARRSIGMIFQQFNLFASRTVRGNVEFPLTLERTGRAERRRRVDELLDFVGIADKAGRYPSELSGGQRQRVGIARALATNPKVLLADEATSALDPDTTRSVLRLLREINVRLGITIVVVTHQMSVVREIAQRMAVMDRGRIVEQGTVFDVYSDPQAPTTRRFLSTVLSEIPDRARLRELHERYGGTLAVVDVRDAAGVRGLVDRLARAGVRADVVYGSISELQGRPFGTVTVRLRGDEDAVRGGLHGLARIREVYPR